MLFIAVIIIHVILSLSLIAIILLQAGRGGLSESFGGGPTQSLFGTQTGNFLTRATAVCAICFFTTCLTLAVLSSLRGRSLMEQVKPMSSQPLTAPLTVAPAQPSSTPAPVPAVSMPDEPAPPPAAPEPSIAPARPAQPQDAAPRP